MQLMQGSQDMVFSVVLLLGTSRIKLSQHLGHAIWDCWKDHMNIVTCCDFRLLMLVAATFVLTPIQKPNSLPVAKFPLLMAC